MSDEATGDRLDVIFELQRGLSELMKLDRYPEDAEGRISALSTAIMHEAMELQRTTNWKMVEDADKIQRDRSQGRADRYLAFCNSGIT